MAMTWEPGPLPSGRHKLPREFVVSSQRDRILDAIANVCAEKGYVNVTVADIVNRAGVSRSTFYELYKDKEACFLAAYDAILAKFLADLLGSVERIELTWIQGVRAGVDAIVRFLAAEPAFARMCMVDMLVAGPAAIERYDSAIRVIATYVERGRDRADAEPGIPGRVASAIVAGGAAVIRDEILAGRPERIPELAPDLVYLALVPYVGRGEAMRQARAAREGLDAASPAADPA
jgi:AcrR family transcriptional regulator